MRARQSSATTESVRTRPLTPARCGETAPRCRAQLFVSRSTRGRLLQTVRVGRVRPLQQKAAKPAQVVAARRGVGVRLILV